MNDIGDLLNQLRKLAEERVVFGKAIMPEDEFYIALTRLKKWVVTEKVNTDGLPPTLREVVAKIDRFEDLIQQSPGFFGFSYVQPKRYTECLAALEQERTLTHASAQIKEFENLSKPLLGFLKVDEAEFFIAVTKLKKSLGSMVAPDFAASDRCETQKRKVLQALEELQNVALNSKGVLGKVLVPQDEYLKVLEILSVAATDLAQARKT